MVNRVVVPAPAAAAVSTSKYGNNRVAAGVTPMSHESLLLVVAGCPVAKVSSGVGSERVTAKADPAIKRIAAIAKTKKLFMLISYTSNVQKCVNHPRPPSHD